MRGYSIPSHCPRRRSVRTMGVVALVAVLLSGLGGCRQVDQPAGAPGETGPPHANQGVLETAEKARVGGKAVFALSAETNGWNPGLNSWATSGIQVAHALFDTLAAFDEKFEVHPYLAEGFRPNRDFTEWTIQLRPGARFSNGRAVDAGAVRRNLVYYKASPITGPVFTWVQAVETDGDDRVKVKLSEPWVTFPSLLTSQVGVVGDPDWIESNDGRSPIGTGPFIMDEWQQNNTLRTHRNPDYWQRDANGVQYPYLDNLEFRVITDGASREASLRSGDVDLGQFPEAAQILSFKDDVAEFQVFSDQKGETDENFVMLNNARPPFDDPEARRALAYATDVDAYNEVDNNNFWPAADGPFDVSSPWHTPTNHATYDLAKAKELVARVKGRHGGEFTFALMSSANAGSSRGVQILAQQWAEAGITAKIESVEQTTLIIEVVYGRYQATIWSLFASPDPILEATWWDPKNFNPETPGFSLNFARFNDPEIGIAFTRARGSTDREQVKRDIGVVVQRINDIVPYIWLNHRWHVLVASEHIANVTNWHLPDGEQGNRGSAMMVHQIWLTS